MLDGVGILITIYFIHDQFEFSAIKRFSYWIIPIFTCYEFVTTFKWSTLNGLLLSGIVVFAYFVSRYQAMHTRIRLEETATTYFHDAAGQEVPIYRKVVTAQGGRHYLYGWLMVIGMQLLIEATYLHEHLTAHRVWTAFFEEIMADVLSFYRFASADSHTSWIIWALTAATSLGYTLWLAHRSPAARRTLFNQMAFTRVAEEEDQPKR
ncbi:hypothetical protein [Lactiplantibacillus daowaiensis]|uniref:Integral membrane protein n=1 Tax=Lactiplantibacillus daowaiensis TaxID=2559918 RepID=A0ABW1S0I6_9LACO|nr:hypothetical protein [Lactiplantibacillus daowaiensis]